MSRPEHSTTGEAARYRLVVRSALEAVALVRERFGPEAKVLSVRQLEAGGLARFLQKPRLEVIVEVGEQKLALPVADGNAGERDTIVESGMSEEAHVEYHAPSTTAVAIPSVRRSVRGESDRVLSVLRTAGVDESLLERVRADHPDFNWEQASASEVLGRLVGWLRRQFTVASKRVVGNRRVFLGSCGAGKTTALCKTLALDVFVRRANVAVLKLDGEHPNATDGLAAFCDVLNAPLLRSAVEVEEFDDDTTLLVDVPGVGLDARMEHRRLLQTLDALHIDTRILVVNTTWEVEVIADAYEMGRTCGATHVFFSHLDEVRCPGKLWRFALFGGLAPLAACFGPSPAGEIDEDVFTALLSRSFPSALAQAVDVEGGGA